MGYQDRVASIATKRFDKDQKHVKWFLRSSQKDHHYIVEIVYEVKRPNALNSEKGVRTFSFSTEELLEVVPESVTDSFELHAVVKAVKNRQNVYKKWLEEAIQEAKNTKNCIQLFESRETEPFLHSLAQDTAFIKMAVATRDYRKLLRKKSSDD